MRWPLPATPVKASLHAHMYRRAGRWRTLRRADFAYLHKKLRRRGVNRLLLWKEYKAAHPIGWQYSVFCVQYRRWLSTQGLVRSQLQRP